MMGGGEVLIIAAAIALIAFGAYAAYMHNARRLDALGALAMQLGWQFEPSDDREHPQRYGYLSVFDQGDDRCAYNTLVGAIEVAGQAWPARAGDYRYETTSGTGKDRRTTTHRLTYLIVETPHLGAPDLYIRREGLMDRFAGFLGFDDIDFESAEFSEKFLVKSSNKRFAYGVIEPRMMEFLLDGQPPTIEFRRGHCCFHDRERTMSPEELQATIQWAGEFLSRWPKKLPSVLEG
jgi:hypothetical protein